MAELLSIATARPGHRVGPADTKRHLPRMLRPSAAMRAARLVDAGANESRHGVLPFDELVSLRGVEKRNGLYAEHAVRLGVTVARQALDAARIAPGEITAIIGVSSTGYLMPGLETHLLEQIRLSPGCRRIPLVQLGCAGGVAGLGLAHQLSSTAEPANVLLVSVELPSLSFPAVEPSATDVFAALQFGDGAAAAVIASGDRQRGPMLEAAGSVVFPKTLDRDGVRLTADGLRLVRPRGLAELLQRELGAQVDAFLSRQRLRRADVAFWVVHPRNPELLAAAGASLGLSDDALAASYAIWRRTGNCVSAAVFHVLEELQSAAPPAGALGMLIAYGAGFGCEMVLLRAQGWLSAPRRSPVAARGGAAAVGR